MAITAATRTDIIELVVLATGGAPGVTKLSELVEVFESANSLAAVATNLTSSASFKATYPTFQTPEEFGGKFLDNILPGLDSAVKDEGVAAIAAVLNGGGTRADVLIQAAAFLSGLDTADANFGSSAALFQNQVTVATYHTVELGLDDNLTGSIANVTSDETSVTDSQNTLSGDTTAEATAAATALETAQTAVTTATDAAAAYTAAKAASDAAAATAAETDAVALRAASDAAAADAAAAVTAKEAADAAVVTAQAELDAAIADGNATLVSEKNGNLIIKQSQAATAATNVTTTAEAAATALAAAEAAEAADAEATTTAAATAEALATANAAAAADDTAAAAAVTAAQAYLDAATASLNTVDDPLAATALESANAVATSAAATTQIDTGTTEPEPEPETEITYALSASSSSVTEGSTTTYTVTASAPVVTDTVVTFTVTPGDPNAADQGTSTTNLNDFAAGTFNPSSVTIPAGSTTATFDLATLNDNKTELPESYVVTAVVGTTTLTSTGSLLDGTTATTVALTTSVDSPVASTGDLVVNGVLVKDYGTGTTAQPGDNVTGGSSTNDSVNIQISGSHTGAKTLTAFQTSGVERFIISNFEESANNDTIDASLMTGLVTVGLSSSSATGDVVFTGLKNIVGAEMKNGAGDLTLTYAAGVTTGSNTQSLALSNITAGTFTAAGVETINLSTGDLAASTLTQLTATSMSKLNITGSQNLTITANALDFAGTTGGTLDASAFTGKLNLNMATAETVTVTGGTGNDTFDYGTTWTTSDTLDGGDGTDVLSVNQDTFTASSYTKLSNVETVKVEATAGNTLTGTTSGNSTITTLQLVENNTDNQNIDATVDPGTTVEIINDVDAQDIAAVTVNLTDPAGTEDSVSIVLKGTSGHGAADNTLASLTTANIETVNLESGAAGTALGSTDDNTVTSLAVSGASTLNLTGSNELDITVAATTALKTIDASAMTDSLTLNASNITSATTITGGSSNDTITMGAKLGSTDVIDGGANSSTGADVLTADLSTGSSASPTKYTIANIEDIVFKQTGTSYIDASAITGSDVTINFWNADGDTSGTTISNLAAGVNIGLGKDANTESNGLITVSLADESGSSDSLNIEVGDQAVDDDVDADIKTTGIETINIKRTSTDADNAAIDMTLAKAATINLTGGTTTAETNLDTLSTSTTLVDASTSNSILHVTASTTGTTIKVKNGVVANTITGGAGNDTVTIGTLTTDDADGAGGTDTLNATIASNITEATANFETVNYTIANAKTVTVTGADGKGVDAATTFNLFGGNSLTTYTANLVSPASLTKIDMSGYTGDSTQLTFAASQLKNTMDIIGSAGTKDTIITTTNNDNAAVKSMTGIETLTLNVAGGASAFDFKDVTGLTKVNVDDDNTARAITLTDLPTGTGVGITTGADTTQVVVDLKDKTGSDNAVTLTTGTTVGTVNIDVEDVETVTISNTTGASTVDLAGMLMTTAGATNTLKVTGSQTLTISALNSDVRTIDASGMSAGGVVVSATSVTGASTITGSSAADTFIMANAGDAIAAGAGSDTLTVKYTSVLGGISVDLSSTGDQIATFNGASNSAVQSGFVNVDLSAYNGNGGEITANSAGSKIGGSTSVDSIILGSGTDTISYTIAAQFDSTDSIDNYTVGTDKWEIKGSLLGDGNTTVTFDSAATVTADANGEVNVVTTALADDAAIIAAIRVSTATTPQIFFVYNTADAETQVWYDANSNVDGGEKQIATLVGVTDAGMDAIATGQFTFVA